MVENLPSCSDEIIQPRMRWNSVLGVAKNISLEAEKAEIDPYQLVFVGGIATFLHAKEFLGNKAVNLWRGTDDVDIIVTERGGLGKILAGLQKSDKYEFIDPVHSHFIDKQTWKVQSKPHGFLAEPDRSTDVDVYFLNKDSRNVDFNTRRILPYPNNFITQPVVLKNIAESFYKSKPKSLVAVPSILDCLIMKLDVAGTSGKFRGKDQNDILSLLMAAEKQGINESHLLQKAINSIEGVKNLGIIANELTDTFSGVIKCYQNGRISGDRKAFLPSKEYIINSNNSLQSMGLNKKNIWRVIA